MSKTITTIEIYPDKVRIASAKKKKDGLKLLKLIEQPISLEEDPSRILLKALKENKIKVDYLKTSLPREAVTIKSLELPGQSEEEIAQMVKFQAEKFLPYSLDNLVIDHKIISFGETSSKVILVLAPKERVAKHLEVFLRAGLFPDEVLYSCEAYLFAASSSKEEMLILNLEPFSQEVAVIKEGGLIASRALSIKPEELRNNPAKLISQMEMTLRGTEGFKPDKILLGGSLAECSGLREELEEAFGAEVSLLDPFSKIELPKELLKKVEGRRHLFFVTAGLLKSSFGKPINLLPAEIKEKIENRRRKANLFLSGFLILSLLVLSFSLLARDFLKRKSYLDYLAQESKALKVESSQIEEKKKRLSIIEDFILRKDLPLKVLLEVSSAIRKDSSLNNLFYDETERVVILYEKE